VATPELKIIISWLSQNPFSFPHLSGDRFAITQCPAPRDRSNSIVGLPCIHHPSSRKTLKLDFEYVVWTSLIFFIDFIGFCVNFGFYAIFLCKKKNSESVKDIYVTKTGSLISYEQIKLLMVWMPTKKGELIEIGS